MQSKAQEEESVHLPEDELHRRGFVTNYPSSRYWKSSFTPTISENNRLHLYIHIPYCIQRCAYCFFKITELADSDREQMEQYVDYLCREIAMVSQAYSWQHRPVDTLYFGGGTPSLLRPKQLEKILNQLNKHFNLALTEFVFEVEPITYTKSKAQQLGEFGITRMSFGIQSFVDDIVRKTGRKDTEKMNIEAIDRALDSGVTVNIDLLSGLEGETMETWQHSVERAISLDVHAITVYKMELYKNSKYFSAVRKNTIILPSDDEEIAFMRMAMGALKRANYQPSTYFTFTKNGDYPQGHIIKRWRGEDTYGFGVSAFSSLEQAYIQNTSNTQTYIDKIENAELPIDRGMHLNSREIIARDIVLGMKTSQIDLIAFQQKHGIELASPKNEMLHLLIKKGFLTIENNVLKLTEQGVMYGDFSGKSLASAWLESGY
ncbi:coproporphyrinogen-III oxidase family protein [Sessilibacter corallicola]|uniref:coproporphyrinogen-III oxidase family protein n=1 Tax=Sessilibacter corallicola TaxID=2904075 RepID=UPI001E3E7697|nr:coproporphyrinogen-III oxidase family protein [Sessilibacter corallicola]MCE2026809.1 coproporphyrinogen III oxidase family protein [Sessilibacter corallicola]